MRRDEIPAVVREVVAASSRPIAAAWLYGSVARGEEHAASDVDVALLLAKEPKGTLADLPSELEAELERRVGRPVQVVVMNRAPVELAMNVIADGVLLFERDAARRVAWEVRTFQGYWDLAPLLAIYRDSGRKGR